MVVHTGHADDVPRLAAGPQEDVPVLGAVGLAAEAADLVDDVPPHQVEVREVVDREENLGTPLGLEQRVLTERRILVDTVLVGVEKVGFGIGGDSLGHPLQCERGELVIVVEQRDEFTASHRERSVGVGRDAAVGVEKRDAEPRVASSPLLEQAAVFEIVRGRTDHACFPVDAGLGGERFERPNQKACLHTVHWDQHADQRSRRRGSVPRSQSFCLPVAWHFLSHDPGRIFRG